MYKVCGNKVNVVDVSALPVHHMLNGEEQGRALHLQFPLHC